MHRVFHRPIQNVKYQGMYNCIYQKLEATEDIINKFVSHVQIPYISKESSDDCIALIHFGKYVVTRFNIYVSLQTIKPLLVIHISRVLTYLT